MTRVRERSDSYRMTITSFDDPAYLKLKAEIRALNAELPKDSTFTHVTYTMPRLGKDSPYAKLYKRKRSSTIKVAHGAYFDIYVTTKKRSTPKERDEIRQRYRDIITIRNARFKNQRQGFIDITKNVKFPSRFQFLVDPVYTRGSILDTVTGRKVENVTGSNFFTIHGVLVDLFGDADITTDL